MRIVIKIIDYILGRSGIHLVGADLSFIKKNIKCSLLPRIDDIVYFTQQNYEVTRVLHNFEGKRHTILIVIVPIPQKIISDAAITFE